jgi:hypothetical protein
MEKVLTLLPQAKQKQDAYKAHKKRPLPRRREMHEEDKLLTLKLRSYTNNQLLKPVCYKHERDPQSGGDIY